MEQVIKKSKTILVFSVIVYIIYVCALYYAGGAVANYVWGAIAVAGFSLLSVVANYPLAKKNIGLVESVSTYYRVMWKPILFTWIVMIILLVIGALISK